MSLWKSHCARFAGHSGALGSATLTAILSASGHWEISSCESMFVTMCSQLLFPDYKTCCCIYAVAPYCKR